ncbi:MAG: hypothetical protein WA634_19035, partial [Silvibacterium sp.]
MSAALTLPYVWATAVEIPEPRENAEGPARELAFYRKRTEALLRRYLRASLSVGRIPSVANDMTLRGRVSSYRMKNFEDVVIFDLSVLKNQMTTLLGDGNSGRIAAIEGRVDQHERSFQRAKGFAVAMGGIFAL